MEGCKAGPGQGVTTALNDDECIYFKSEAKMIATENTEATEDFLSVFSVLSVADNTNNDSYRCYYPTF